MLRKHAFHTFKRSPGRGRVHFKNDFDKTGNPANVAPGMCLSFSHKEDGGDFSYWTRQGGIFLGK